MQRWNKANRIWRDSGLNIKEIVTHGVTQSIFKLHINSWVPNNRFFIIPIFFFAHLHENWHSQYKHPNIKISVIKYEENMWKTYEKYINSIVH